MEVEYKDLSDLVAASGDSSAQGVYEVGYHLVPTLAEDDIEGAVAPLMKALHDAGATVIGERAPLLMRLAYGIDKKIDGVMRVYDEAYFGWVAFEAPRNAVADINEAFKKHEHVLRFLITTTDRETVAAVLADPSLDAAMAKEEREEVSEEGAEGVVESVGADPESGSSE